MHYMHAAAPSADGSANGFAQVFLAMAKASSDGQFWLGPDGAFRYLNPVCAALCGVSADQCREQPEFFWDALHPDDRERVRSRVFAALLLPGEVRASCRALGPDGRELRLELHCIPAFDGPAFLGLAGTLRDDTLAAADRRDLLHAREKYETFYQNAPLGIFRSTIEGRFLSVNPALAAMLGDPSPKATLARVKDIARDVYAVPARRGEVLRTLERDPGVATFESLFRRRDGSLFAARLHTRLVRGDDGRPLHLEGLVEDVTERTRAEEEVRQNTSLLQAVFSAIPDTVTVVDRDYGVVISNAPDDTQCGPSPRCFALLRGRDLPCDACLARATFIDGRAHRGEIRHPVTGAYLEIATLPIVDPSGTIRQVVEIQRDVTEQKKAQELREDVERITRHDLKSPIISAMTIARMVRSEPLTRRQESLLDEMETSCRNMLALIGRSLDLYRMETGAYTLSAVPVDLAGLTRRVFNELGPTFGRKNIAFSLAVRGGSGRAFTVACDEMLVYVMLVNLLKNAAEAAPPGGRVSVVMYGGDTARIAIHNPGAVPVEVRECFFEKYTTAGKAFGTGLGTYSAKIIAVTHGGSIEYSTSEATGTTVTVSLPRTH